jgi:hypothetical protein
LQVVDFREGRRQRQKPIVPALTLHIFQKYVADIWMHFISEIRLSLPVLFIRQITALTAGAREGHVEICKLLISAKADAAARDLCDAISLAARAYDAVRHSHAFLQPRHRPQKRHE